MTFFPLINIFDRLGIRCERNKIGSNLGYQLKPGHSGGEKVLGVRY